MDKGNIGEMSRRAALGGALSWPLAAGLAVPAKSATARQASGGARILVAYLSRTGNTRVVARQIRWAHDAELFEILPASAYPEDYEETVRQATRERASGYQPPLARNVADIAAYDVVFLGFPIWGTSAPATIRSFLSRHDLPGKTLVPFITHGGYGPGDSLAVVAAHAPRARVLDPFVLRADQERETLARVTQWMARIEAPL